MKQYRVGEAVRLGEGRHGISRRFEVVRPDGSPLPVDWDKRVVTLRPGLPGVWHWRMYMRDETGPRTESDTFEVVATDDLSATTRLLVRLARVRGRS